jgi:hypothetical protein
MPPCCSTPFHKKCIERSGSITDLSHLSLEDPTSTVSIRLSASTPKYVMGIILCSRECMLRVLRMIVISSGRVIATLHSSVHTGYSTTVKLPGLNRY